MKTIVFLGPSLALAEAKTIYPDAIYRSPVACGDVLQSLAQAPERIAIIDGFFHNQAAVWHKEILYALSLGIEVWGCSSMGALRAAELNAFGMQGLGEIFSAYQQGVYEDDDEVAVLHACAKNEYRPVSDAMVNIRATLAVAKELQLLTAEEHDLLVSNQKAMFYQHRDLRAAVVKLSAQLAQPKVILSWLEKQNIDQKKTDAMALLQQLVLQEKQTSTAFKLNHTSQLTALQTACKKQLKQEPL